MAFYQYSVCGGVQLCFADYAWVAFWMSRLTHLETWSTLESQGWSLKSYQIQDTIQRRTHLESLPKIYSYLRCIRWWREKQKERLLKKRSTITQGRFLEPVLIIHSTHTQQFLAKKVHLKTQMMTSLKVDRDQNRRTSTKGKILMKVNLSVQTSRNSTKSSILRSVTAKTQSFSMLSSVTILVQSNGLTWQLFYAKMIR